MSQQPATALVIGKNLYFNIWHEGINSKFYLPILELLSHSYEALIMIQAKKLVDNEIKKTITMYKNISRNSSKFKGYSLFQLSCSLTGMSYVIGYYSYIYRCVAY